MKRFTLSFLHFGVLVSIATLVFLANAEDATSPQPVPESNTPTNSMETVSFDLKGTPLLSRVQEIEGIVWPEDLAPSTHRTRGVPRMLPSVSPSESGTKQDGLVPLPSAGTVAGGNITFVNRPAENPSSGLRLLMQLSGIQHEPPTIIYFKPHTGLLMVRTTPKEMIKIRALVHNPPTNAVAYLKSLSQL